MNAGDDNMAFTQPHTINFTDSEGINLEFLHEIIKTPEIEKNGLREYHTQDYCELIFFNSGEREIQVGDAEYFFKAGDIFVVSPDEAHRGKSKPCILDRYYIHIYPDTFSHLKNNGNDLMKIFYNRKKNTDNKITLPVELQNRIQKLLTSLDNTVCFGSKNTKDFESYAFIIEILTILNNFSEKKTNYSFRKNELFLNILSYIENSYPESDLMQSIIKNFGISRSSLWRLFKSELNTTPYDFLYKTRLKNAALLLKHGYDVTTAAQMCGFSDCSHFIKKFKEHYKMTPFKYKKAFLAHQPPNP